MKKVILMIALITSSLLLKAQVIDTGGNVGIGTTIPNAKLDVNGNINFTASQGVWLTGKTDTGGINSSTQLSQGAYQSLVRQKTASGHVVNLGGIGDVFGLFGFDKNRITNGFDHSMAMDVNNGYVGIGTANPAAKLDVNGNINFASSQGVWLIGKTDTGGINSSTQLKTGHYQSLIRQKTASNNVVNIGGIGDVFGFFGFDKNRTSNGVDHSLVMNTNSGNIGIGVVEPKEKLHLEGNLLIDVFDKGNESGIFFREGFSQSNKYNLSILTFDHNGSSADGLSMNAYDGISFSTGSGTRNERMRITQNGDVGIGTINTFGHKLAVAGGVILDDNLKFRYTGKKIGYYNDEDHKAQIQFYNSTNGNIEIENVWNGGNADIVLKPDNNVIVSNGNVGIGTTNTFGYKLAVNGNIGAKEIKVEVNSQWPDYVFNKAYNLPTLKEVEKHIEEKGHLPNIPSAKEVKENKGIELGKMNAKLLEKIEELTLYTIQQEKEIQELKNQNKQFKKLAKEIALIKAKLK